MSSQRASAPGTAAGHREHGPPADAASSVQLAPPSTAPALSAARTAGALLLILLLAGVLRFTGLGWGLRHPPFSDERSFVTATAGMLARGDLDHRFYEYPGLFFYLLLPLLAWLPAEARTGPAAYLMARALVAAFSLASVAVVFFLGRRLGGARLGLVAALMLAVSPVDVSTAHMVRPDVVLGTFVLLALIAFDRLERPAGDALSGLGLGLAASVKFTGLLLLPSYLLQRAFVPGRRLGGALRAALFTALVGVIATPYALLRPADFARGARYQLTAHYRGSGAAPGLADNLAFYLRTAEQALGPLGALLAMWGVVVALREGRRWLPVLLFPVVLMLVMSTAELRFSRFLVPATGLLALFAARAVEALGARARWLAALLALLAVLPPLGAAAQYVRKSARPSPRDMALDWIAAHVPPGARVLDLCRDLSFGLDARRYEIVELRPKTRHVARLAAEMDLIVAYPDAAARLDGFESVLHVRADRGEAPFELLVPGPGRRIPYSPLPLAGARLRVSSGPERAEALRDGDAGTTWGAATPASAGADWIEVRLAEPRRVGRVELALGTPPRPCAGRLGLQGSADGAGWDELAVLPGRPAPEDQLGARSEVLVLAALPLRALRITCSGRGPGPWEVAELSLAAPMESRSGRVPVSTKSP